MPRDASGNYSLPAGNPVVSGTTIDSVWANDTMDDVSVALTDSLDREGRGGMNAPFLNADGLVNSPGISWSNEPSSGWYRFASGDFRYSISGLDVIRINAGNLFVWSGAPDNIWRGVLVEGGAGAVLWGTIGGTLSDQLDLQSALDTAGVTADWGAIDGTLADQLDLQAALDGKLDALIEDPAPALANILDVGLYGLGSAHTTTIGTDFVIGDVGYLNSSGTISLAQANAEVTTMGDLYMATAPITAGAVGPFMELGVVPGLAGLVGGSTYYISAATAGKITNVQPSAAGEFVRIIGYTGNVTTQINFRPDGTWIKLA